MAALERQDIFLGPRSLKDELIMQELTKQELEQVNGGLLPLVIYAGAVALGAVIGFGICAVQAMVAIHRDS